MGFFRTAQKSSGVSSSSAVIENPQKKIVEEMAGQGRIFALFTKDGQFLVDHFGKNGVTGDVDSSTQVFYLAVNLNFIHDFGNSVKLGIYNPQGTEMLSPDQASFKLVYHLGDDVIVHTNSKKDGNKINITEYEDGIMLVMLKLPKNWTLPQEGQLRLKVQSSLMFNPTELETFLLKLPVKKH